MVTNKINLIKRIQNSTRLPQKEWTPWESRYCTTSGWSAEPRSSGCKTVRFKLSSRVLFYLNRVSAIGGGCR